MSDLYTSLMAHYREHKNLDVSYASFIPESNPRQSSWGYYFSRTQAQAKIDRNDSFPPIGTMWEYVVGFWMSRDLVAFHSDSPEIIAGIARVDWGDGTPTLLLITKDGSTHTSPSVTSSITRILEADRRARERLNLAPLPNEFRTWLLTGEPASVGDGTFVPPLIQ